MKKRKMTVLFLLGLALCLIAVQAAAASELTEASITFTVRDSEYTVVSYKHNDAFYFLLPSFAEETDAAVSLTFSSGAAENVQARLIPGEDLICTCKGRDLRFRTVRSGNIPALFIDVSAAGGLNRLNKSKSNVLPGSAVLTAPSGEILYSGELTSVKGRGNKSWDMPKKGYGMKLAEKADLLGMGKDRNWVLIPTYRDNSLLNFRIINDLAFYGGMPFAQQSRYVDLYIDGDYRGVYLLTEKMETGKNRIDIRDLEEATEQVNTEPLNSFRRRKLSNIERSGAAGFCWTVPNDPEDITGGYLLEFDTAEKAENEASRFGTDNGLTLSVKSPKYITEAQLTYIAVLWQDFENALYSRTGYNRKGIHYSEYIDMESFAMLWLLDEFGMEIDISSSHYFWKDSDLTGDGKIHACAPWDVEHCFKREKYAFDYLPANGACRHFWRDLYNLHEDFRQTVREVWQNSLYPALCLLLDEDNTAQPYTGMCSYDTYVSFVEPAARMNFIRWPRALSTQVDDRSCKTWEECVEYVRKYLTGRTAYMNTVYGADAAQ